MTRKEYNEMYINNATLTDRQKQHRAAILQNADNKRRKFNIVGGIVSAVATLYICKEYAHIDYTQALTENDKIIIAAVYMACLMLWRFVRQKISAATTPKDTYGQEERKAVDEMTPQQARQYLRELDELQTAYKNGKNTGNTFFIMLICAAAVGMYCAIKGGII